MKNMVATSWSRDKEKEDGSKEEVEDPQSDALPNQSTGRPTSFHHRNRDVNASRNILMLLMMEIRGSIDQVSSSQLHKCHRGAREGTNGPSD
jgi:hypothetical protein